MKMLRSSASELHDYSRSSVTASGAGISTPLNTWMLSLGALDLTSQLVARA